MRQKSQFSLVFIFSLIISFNCLGAGVENEDPCSVSPKAQSFAKITQQTIEDACITLYNLDSLIVSAQTAIRRIAGDQSDDGRLATYEEKMGGGGQRGLIDIAIEQYFMSEDSKVQVIPNRKQSVVPITLGVRQYLRRVAEYSRDRGYKYVRLVFDEEATVYNKPFSSGGMGNYQVQVDTVQGTILCLTNESETCHVDLTKKVFWVNLIKSDKGGFGLKIEKVTAESIDQYDELCRFQSRMFGTSCKHVAN
jgi:hypothetical protein